MQCDEVVQGLLRGEALTKPRLESATLIPVPKSTTTLAGWIIIVFSNYVTKFSTVVAYNCIVVLVSLVGVVIPVVWCTMVRPVAVTLRSRLSNFLLFGHAAWYT